LYIVLLAAAVRRHYIDVLFDVFRKKALLAALCSWHQATRLSKIKWLHDQSAARELRRHHLLKAAFSHWYDMLLRQRAEVYHKTTILR
jgi:hypothetical protein